MKKTNLPSDAAAKEELRAYGENYGTLSIEVRDHQENSIFKVSAVEGTYEIKCALKCDVFTSKEIEALIGALRKAKAWADGKG